MPLFFGQLLFAGVAVCVLSLIACAGRVGLICASILAFAGALFISILTMNPLVPGVGLVITASVGVGCARDRKGVRTFFLSSLANMTVPLFLASALGVYYVWRCAELRDRYPYVSLAPRLAYESRPRQAPVRTDSEAGLHLGEIEREVGELKSYGGRAASLELIHRSAVQLFINSPGFGPGRNLGPSAARTVAKEYPAIPFDTDDDGSAAADLLAQDSAKASGAKTSPPIAPPPYLWASHSTGLIDFVNSDGFGHVIDRDHVSGFQSHQFRRGVTFGARKTDGWRVRRLELVSLLKFEEPAVYLTDRLPRMDRLGDGTTTRPLDPFERDALESLRSGEDLVAVPKERVVRVLGSIRAVKQCLACHTAERGELLGAFSYVLQPPPR